MKISNKHKTNRMKISVSVFSVIIFLISFSCNTKNNNSEINILPFSELKFTDVGQNTKPGAWSVEKNVLSVVAGGADIWGTQDEFYFGYKEIDGDFDISVQILELGKTHLYTKAGIMARTDLSDNCLHTYFQIFPDNSQRNKNNGGCEFQYRAEKGGEMKAIYPNQEIAGDKFNVQFPDTWIRLKRDGNVFESYISNDNKSWELYSNYTLEMQNQLLVGIAVTSHDPINFTNVKFEDLQLNN